jgi:hypothetical protein
MWLALAGITLAASIGFTVIAVSFEFQFSMAFAGQPFRSKGVGHACAASSWEC